jgi:hypothetical protein
MAFDVPIAFCIYNRPEMTRQVLSAIRVQRPKKLFVIADGPKVDDELDELRVQETLRSLELIDWSCDVVLGDSLINLGCRNRIATGLTWAFEQTERLIILEDDCLPSPAFFSYCRDLLDRYADDERVMMISGDRFYPAVEFETDYYFSRWTHIWGWASWRRAWQKFDVDLNSWPSADDQGKLQANAAPREFAAWRSVFEKVYRQELDTWDFSWQYACWLNDGLVAVPPRNLVTNIGFGAAATHTHDPNSQWANLPAFDFGEYSHPSHVRRNVAADDWSFENIFAPAFEQPPKAKRKSRMDSWWRSWNLMARLG